MSKSGAAKRYASALFELAAEQSKIAQIEQELRVVKEVFDQNQELIKVLESPKLSIENKQVMIGTAFAQVSAPVVNTLKLLVQRHRTGEILDMCNEFMELVNEQSGTADALVYSVRPLTPQEEASVSAEFARKAGKQMLRIENIVDPSLLGGLKIRIGNRIYDGSLQGKLNRLQKQLAKNSTI